MDLRQDLRSRPLAAEAELSDALDGLQPDDWIRAALIFLVALVVSRAVQMVTTRIVHGEDGSAVAARFVGRCVAFVVVLVGFVYSLNTLNVRLGPLLGALGIGGLAVAFAAQSILENFFSSLLLQARRPFRIGHQVSIAGGIEGVVEDVNFRVVIIRTFDGERVFIPASEVLQNPIVNVTVRGPWRTSLAVGVAYGSDLRRAQEVLLDAVTGTAGVLPEPPPEVWVEALGDSSIDLSVRFWHTPEMAVRWRVRSEVAMTAVDALGREGIVIPFPQRTIWFGEEPAAGATPNAEPPGRGQAPSG